MVIEKVSVTIKGERKKGEKNRGWGEGKRHYGD
jgi:hypothetical protein